MLFNSSFVLGAKMKDFTQHQIKNEEMFFNCDLDFAYEKGGPITRNFIDCLPEDVKKENPVLDSRVHMLMKGWFPAIPGFHHDDVPRSTANGQPNYANPEYHAEHALALVNGNICPTEFAIGTVELEIPKEGIIYKHWHKEIEKQIQNDSMKSVFAPSNQILFFDAHDFHQATRAVADGWRWFARISWNTDRQKTMTNEIRRNCQVYLEHPMEGW